MGAQQQQQRTESPDSEDYEDEMVVPTPTNPQNLSVAIAGGSEGWNMAGGDAHAGLEVYTVGHLMPRGGSFTDAQGNWSFDGSGAFADEMVGKQEATYASTSSGSGSGSSGSPPQKQTLRVRRSTFVPGWAVPPRVLLVDDDAVSRKLSSKFLQVFGCTIDVAVDGVGAVNKMNLEKYDLVLMVCLFTFFFCFFL